MYAKSRISTNELLITRLLHFAAPQLTIFYQYLRAFFHNAKSIAALFLIYEIWLLNFKSNM